MKIAIVNQPLANRGDESAHKAFVRQLAKSLPNSQIDVLFLGDRQDWIDEFCVHLPNVRYINITGKGQRFVWRVIKECFWKKMFFMSYYLPPLSKFRRYIKKYDKIICAPGGMCMGGFLNWMHIWILYAAMKLKKPIMYWGRSIGPFTEEDYVHKIFKERSIELLKYFSYISLRDSISVKFANNFGIAVDEIVDSAFLECPKHEIPTSIINELGNNEFLVFVPNELKWHPRYKNVEQHKIDSFYLCMINLITNQYPDTKIVMLPQTYKSCINDYDYFIKLKSICANKNIIVVDENQNSDIQQTIISKAKMVIGARYHSIVFAINNEIPFISLSYEHKMKGLLEKLNYKESLVEIQNIFDIGNENMYESTLEKVKTMLARNTNVSNDLAKQIVRQGFKNLIKSLIKQ
ncbi:MAG: polysaccharide pyruvyl transferase family protein [Bacteroidales bacterium]|nr:polysaccharide pyruvyl transferase family protein [Bacteroidales bacterium]